MTELTSVPALYFGGEAGDLRGIKHICYLNNSVMPSAEPVPAPDGDAELFLFSPLPRRRHWAVLPHRDLPLSAAEDLCDDLSNFGK